MATFLQSRHLSWHLVTSSLTDNLETTTFHSQVLETSSVSWQLYNEVGTDVYIIAMFILYTLFRYWAYDELWKAKAPLICSFKLDILCLFSCSLHFFSCHEMHHCSNDIEAQKKKTRALFIFILPLFSSMAFDIVWFYWILYLMLGLYLSPGLWNIWSLYFELAQDTLCTKLLLLFINAGLRIQM